MYMKTSWELFGIECGPGWEKLYRPLIRRCQEEGVQILQVKEKFGGLRFYVGGANKELWDLIQAYESLSYSICESCGGEENGVRCGGKGWIQTLCEPCRRKGK